MRGSARPPARVGQPLVSIITPTLNQAQFIEDTLCSVRDQTYPNIEHIVIDGGSTDATVKMLEGYRGSGRLRWLSEPDDGMYSAINKGLRMASGSIVAYLNSDDVYFPWSVEVAVQSLESRSDIDLVYGDAVNIDDTTGAEHLRIQPAFRATRLLAAWTIPQPAAFWRADVHEKIGYFDESLQCAGDTEFFLRAGTRLSVTKIDEVLAIERLHAGTKSLRWAEQAGREKAALRDRYVAEGVTPGRFGGVEAFAARRLYWMRYLAAQGGLSRGRGWERFRREGRPRISLARLALGMIPGVPLAWKSGSVEVARRWVTTEEDRADLMGPNIG